MKKKEHVYRKILYEFYERGSTFMGYGRRWAVETAFSTYKRLYV
jgi:hypothetical protein